MDSSRTRLSSSSSSFSSCSSSSLVFPGDSPLNSPATTLRLHGVPFSWEQLPGKPKDYAHRLNHRRTNEFSVTLPLPPHRSTTFPVSGKNHKAYIPTKKNSFPVMVKDPFATALLECSKSDDEESVTSRVGTGRSPRTERTGVDGPLAVGGRGVRERFRRSPGGSSKALVKSSIGDRFGLVSLYSSCRRTCAVSESIVYLPRPRKLLLPRRHR